MNDAYHRLKQEEEWWRAMPLRDRQDFEAERMKRRKVDEVTRRIRKVTARKAPI